MTVTPSTDLTAPLNASRPSGSRRAVAAGARTTLTATIGYAVAWIAGLTVFASSTQISANGVQVVRTLAGHQLAAGLQYALTEGVTALCLIAVIRAVTGNARPGRAVNDAITRLDGLKMVLLALVATAAAVAIRDRALPLPRWLSPLAAVLAVAIAVSGVGYLALSDAAASAAWVSLPLLIAFVTASGLATARLRR
jgi:hypothetical protein